MRVWLLVVGEPLPIDEGVPRLHRGGLLAQQLVKQGHEVVWITSTTNHFAKTSYFDSDKDVKVADHFILKFLSAPLYKRNISLTRFYNHYILGKKFSKLAPSLEKPDVIVAAMPTLEFAAEAVKYGQKYNVPIVVDVRDLWPDVFLEILPSFLKPLGKIALWPMYRLLKKAMKATSVVSITQKILAWGREPLAYDKVFPLAYSAVDSAQDALVKANVFWDDFGFFENEKKRYIVYMGNLNKRCDLEIVVETARKCEEREDIHFIICGEGEDRSRLEALAHDLKNITFTGWVDRNQIAALLNRAHVGLMPYPNTFDFQMSIPNKVIEYWSAGLPIASVLNGHLQEVMDKEKVGITAAARTPEAFAKIILDLLEDDKRYEQMRKNALSFFENFRAEKVYKDYVDHLEFLAKKKQF